MAYERHSTRGDRLQEQALAFSAETGIEPELCTLSAIWAQDMAARVLKESPAKLSEEYFLSLQDETGEAIIILPRDADDIPLYRTRYAAQEIFYNLVAHKYPNARTEVEGTPLKITVHYDKIDEVSQILMTLQRNRDYPYDSVKAEVPNRSENMPSEDVLPRGSEQHAQFLWHVCYWMGGGIQSDTAFKFLGQMYTDHPELFDPRYIVDNEITEEEIETTVSQYSALNFNLNHIKKYWVTNAHRMVDRYDGDVRKVFDGANSYRTIKKRVVNNKGEGFMGFQEKMASMYTHFLADAGIIKEIPFPPAVDFHFLRLAGSLGVLTFENMGKNGMFEPKTINTLRKALYDYIIVTGTSEVELDDAWWRYSKLMCAKSPSSATTVNYAAARGEKSTKIEVNFADPATRKKYARSCGQCALSALCTFSVTSGDYYADDKMTLTPRPTPEQEIGALLAYSPKMPSEPGNKPKAVAKASRWQITPEPLF